MALLIYKQWHRNANKPKTPQSNSMHIKYIGERIHVLKAEGAENGLFGKIGGKDIEKISTADAMSYVEKFSVQKKTMFRSCISFTPERAELLELTSKKSWEKYIRYHAYTLAEKNKIDLKGFEYLAAVHDKKGQPHIHIAFWNINQKVGINYVNPEIPKEIRDTVEIDSFGELAEEMQEDYENPSANSAFTIDNGDSIRKELITKTFENEKKALEGVQNMLFKAFAQEGAASLPPPSEYQKLTEDFEKLAGEVPQKGRMAYGFQEREMKEKIDGFSDELMNAFPDLKELFNDYVSSKRLVSEMYNSTESNIGALNIATAVGKANDSLYKKLGNEILQAIKKYNFERRIAASEAKKKLFEAFVKECEASLSQISEYQDLTEKIGTLADEVPQKSRMLYRDQQQEIKEKIDGVSNELMNTFPDLRALFDDYVLSAQTVVNAYNNADSNINVHSVEKTVNKANDRLYNKLGNEILKVMKKYNFERRIAASQEEFQKRQDEIRQQQSERLVLSVFRVLKEFSKEGHSNVAAAASKAFGRGDLSRAAILDLINKNRDRGQEI